MPCKTFSCCKISSDYKHLKTIEHRIGIYSMVLAVYAVCKYKTHIYIGRNLPFAGWTSFQQLQVAWLMISYKSDNNIKPLINLIYIIDTQCRYQYTSVYVQINITCSKVKYTYGCLQINLMLNLFLISWFLFNKNCIQFHQFEVSLSAMTTTSLARYVDFL